MSDSNFQTIQEDLRRFKGPWPVYCEFCYKDLLKPDGFCFEHDLKIECADCNAKRHEEANLLTYCPVCGHYLPPGMPVTVNAGMTKCSHMGL